MPTTEPIVTFDVDSEKIKRCTNQIFELSRLLRDIDALDEALRITAEKTSDILNADAILVIMINPDTQKTMKTVVRRGNLIESSDLRNFHLQISGWMILHKEPFLSDSVNSDPRLNEKNFSQLKIKSVAAVLLEMHGRVIGALISCNNENAIPFSQTALSFLEYISLVVSPYLAKVEQIRHLFAPGLNENSLLYKYMKVGLIGQNKRFIELLHTIEAVSKCEARVLLEGESGTGKELIAQAIHKFSKRSSKPFITIDCGAIPANLAESELFGYKRGAFTGANENRQGLLEAADGGTVFLDEIANLPMEVQARLLRFLQEGEVRPLGSTQTKKIDVRVISACSKSLSKMVDDGEFREGLYFRLHVYPIFVPSLKERKKDIFLLAKHFVDKFTALQQKHVHGFAPKFREYMLRKPWQGNIRELENFIERLITLVPKGIAEISDKYLPKDLLKEYKKLTESAELQVSQDGLTEQLAELEEKLIRTTLQTAGWNQSQAAQALKISEYALRYKMKKLSIVKPPD